MLLVNSMFDVIDNSGVIKLLSIGNISRKTLKIKLGDIIIGVVKRSNTNSSIKESSIVRALVVQTKMPVKSSFFYIKFENNSVILLNKKNIPLGTRVYQPFFYKKFYFTTFKLNKLCVV